mmetsp:Transcript_18203/g.31155  ORF Transcript_18203/g.31155 Transcript_18203/m.31155 type:complete len:99 (-) Transcript_18203:18-314(-)
MHYASLDAWILVQLIQKLKLSDPDCVKSRTIKLTGTHASLLPHSQSNNSGEQDSESEAKNSAQSLWRKVVKYEELKFHSSFMKQSTMMQAAPLKTKGK